jgi:hypothetical protein
MQRTVHVPVFPELPLVNQKLEEAVRVCTYQVSRSIQTEDGQWEAPHGGFLILESRWWPIIGGTLFARAFRADYWRQIDNGGGGGFCEQWEPDCDRPPGGGGGGGNLNCTTQEMIIEVQFDGIWREEWRGFVTVCSSSGSLRAEVASSASGGVTVRSRYPWRCLAARPEELQPDQDSGAQRHPS